MMITGKVPGLQYMGMRIADIIDAKIRGSLSFP